MFHMWKAISRTGLILEMKRQKNLAQLEDPNMTGRRIWQGFEMGKGFRPLGLTEPFG